MLVCRAWVTRASHHLMARLDLSHTSLHKFCNSFGVKSRAVPLINELNVACNTPWISIFFMKHRQTKINILGVYGLDFAREHISLPRIMKPHSIRCLHLSSIKEANAARLIRFISSFHSLSSLKLHFGCKELKYRGEILPRFPLTTRRTLETFDIHLVSGVSTILDWYLQENSPLDSIKKLVIRCGEQHDRSKFAECFTHMDRVLRLCCHRVLDLTLHLWEVPIVEGVAHLSTSLIILCKSIVTMNTRESQLMNIVDLEDFPMLRRLKYCSYDFEDILEYAEVQLNAVKSHDNLNEVSFDIKLSVDYERRDELYASMDKILGNMDSFPSLSKVESREVGFFPALRARSIMVPSPWSSDLDVVPVGSDFAVVRLKSLSLKKVLSSKQ